MRGEMLNRGARVVSCLGTGRVGVSLVHSGLVFILVILDNGRDYLFRRWDLTVLGGDK